MYYKNNSTNVTLIKLINHKLNVINNNYDI